MVCLSICPSIHPSIHQYTFRNGQILGKMSEKYMGNIITYQNHISRICINGSQNIGNSHNTLNLAVTDLRAPSIVHYCKNLLLPIQKVKECQGIKAKSAIVKYFANLESAIAGFYCKKFRLCPSPPGRPSDPSS